MHCTVQAHAGAVFEEKKPILPSPEDYKINFNLPAAFPPGPPGSIVRSSNPLNKTSIPLARFTLNQCAVLSFHFHPLGSEQLFILQGKIEVGMFFEDQSFRLVPVKAGEGVVIPQGVVHFVRNTAKHSSQFLQIFDHPGAGAQFVGPALLKMPADVLASAFKGAFPPATTGNIFTLQGCKKW